MLASLETHGTAAWLGWIGAAVVAALVTAAAVWTGWHLRRWWQRLPHPFRRVLRPGRGWRAGRTAAPSAVVAAATRAGAAQGVAAYRQAAAAVRPAPVTPADPAAGERPDPGQATALLEELLDRLHTVAASLDRLAESPEAPARPVPAAPTEAGPAWDLEFLQRGD